MRSFSTLFLLSFIAASGGAACRSSSTETADAAPAGNTPDAAPVTGGPDASVAPITESITQLNMTPPATFDVPVTVNNVVVVASKISNSHGVPRYAEAFIQDPGGGMYSGMHVFCDTAPSKPPACTQAMHDLIKSLTAGQVVSVSGTWDQFDTDPPEIKVPTVTVVGTTMPVVAMDVDAATMAFSNQTLPLSVASAYVTVNEPITVSNTTAVEYASTGACTVNGDAGTTPDAASGVPYFGFETTSMSGSTIAVSFNFNFTLDYCLPDCPGYGCVAPNLITQGEVFSHVTGIADVDTFAVPEYVQIDPVTNADMPAQ